MELETGFGLRKHHTYDELVAYVINDPDIIKFPKRTALQYYDSYLNADLRNIYNNDEKLLNAQSDYLNWRKKGQPGPYDPPDHHHHHLQVMQVLPLEGLNQSSQ